MKIPACRLFSLILACATLPLFADQQRARESRETAVNPDAYALAKLDLNTATEADLAAVPVIGAELARVIVAARPFATIHELDRLQGLSAERLEQIRATVIVLPRVTRERVAAAKASAASGADGAHRPARSATTAEAPQLGGSRQVAAPAKLDLNTADEHALAAVPVIGPELARTLVAGRPYASLDELSRLEGLSTERLEQVRAVVTVVPSVVGSKAKRPAESRPAKASRP